MGMVTILEHAGRDVFEHYYADPDTPTPDRVRLEDEEDVAPARRFPILKEEISRDACKDAFEQWLKSHDLSLGAEDYAKIDDLAAKFKEWVDKNKDYVFKGSRLFSLGVVPEYHNLLRHLNSQLEHRITKNPAFPDMVDEWKVSNAREKAEREAALKASVDQQSPVPMPVPSDTD